MKFYYSKIRFKFTEQKDNFLENDMEDVSLFSIIFHLKIIIIIII